MAINLARHRDVEPILAREAVGGAAEADNHLPQCPVVQVHHAPPGDAAGVESRLLPQ